MFSGTYHKDDVTFLLKNIFINSTSVEEKEKNIQKNESHYSEMITHEKAPSAEYMKIFHESLKNNGLKFATHLMALAKKINEDFLDHEEVVIVSLARAGTPVGVILHRLLKTDFSRKVKHYTVSIIRDKGLDMNAMKFITKNHESSSIVFVDGWTGKGVIGEELRKSVNNFNSQHKTEICPNLYVVADISGTAFWSASEEDYLIPSAVLNSTISGLVSRTILNDKYIFDTDYHGCLFYADLIEHDISQWFVNKILELAKTVKEEDVNKVYQNTNIVNKKDLMEKSKFTISYFLNGYGLDNRNFIKPGIGESTRVLLRRIPKEIIVKNLDNPEIQHLLHLAQIKNIKVIVNENLCYNCVSIIEVID